MKTTFKTDANTPICALSICSELIRSNFVFACAFDSRLNGGQHG